MLRQRHTTPPLINVFSTYTLAATKTPTHDSGRLWRWAAGLGGGGLGCGAGSGGRAGKETERKRDREEEVPLPTGTGMMRGVFVLSCSTLRRFSAPAAAGAGKAVARTRGEAPKHNACAASVAPGVPKGRALVPGAGVELPATGSYTKILALL